MKKVSGLPICHQPVSPHFAPLHLHHASGSAAPPASANLHLPVYLLHFPLLTTCATPTNLHQYINPGLWLAQCQIALCNMWHFPAVVSCLPACFRPCLFLICLCCLFLGKPDYLPPLTTRLPSPVCVCKFNKRITHTLLCCFWILPQSLAERSWNSH